MNLSTQVERLARIETLLEDQLTVQLGELQADVKAIRSDLDAETERNAALRNKGVGILIGVTLAAGSLGAAIATKFEQLLGLLK